MDSEWYSGEREVKRYERMENVTAGGRQGGAEYKARQALLGPGA